MSMFGILGNGVTGLSAAQQALDVIGQNIANANTQGYSRQRVNLTTGQGTPTPSLYTGPVTLLNGVSVGSIERIKNAYLQDAADTSSAKQAALTAQTAPLANAEKLFNEPSDTGLQASLDGFYSAWSDVGNPSSTGASAAGAVVISRGQVVAQQLNGLSSGMDTQWRSARANLAGVVDQVNAAATTLADLNGKIFQGQSSGTNVNALLDQRDQVVTKLATLAGTTSQVSDNGQLSVSIGGVALVSGVHAEKMSLNAGANLASAGQLQPSLQIGSVLVSPSSGTAAGLLSALGTDLPNVSAQLDQVATSIRDAVNSLQQQGFTTSGASGTDFFSGTGAADLTVAVTDASQLAVSAVAGSADVSNAQRIADLADDDAAASVLGGNPGPSQLWRTLTTSVGAQVQSLNTAQATQTSLVTAAQAAVDSDSGVSLDEELSNMLLFQRSYQASAKIISVADEMLQTLIGMGS